MLELQKFLRDPANKPEDLTAKLGIAVKKHPKYPNLVLFKYSQIESPMGDPLVQECRGIILDSAKDWAVVSFPYKKFFNHGEGHAAPIDWATAKVFEKADGSLMTLYFYDMQWQVASSGTPDAGGEVYGTGISFSSLFWKVWKELHYNLPDNQDQGMCFMFELCTPFNKQVVQHKANRIIFHGTRNLDPKTTDYLEEIGSLDVFSKDYGWEEIKSYPLGTIDDVMKSLEFIPATDGEGYVICDAAFNRIKVKTPQYVALHHMRDGMGSKRMLEVVRSNESEEFLTYFPEFKSMHAQVKEKYNELREKIEQSWDKVKDMPKGGTPEESKQRQKEFALAVKSTPFNGVLFGLRSGNIETVKQGLRDMNIKYLMESLKIKDIVLEF